VCSNLGDAIDRIAAAIDQLASDTRNARLAPLDGDAAARIAGLWQLISELDPGLARRIPRYASPADGAPPA
jgi:hypothetical protein